MNTRTKDNKARPATERLRAELRKKVSAGELEFSWQLEVLDRLVDMLQMEPVAFHRLWIQPLLDVGLSLEMAVAWIVQSHFQPN